MGKGLPRRHLVAALLTAGGLTLLLVLSPRVTRAVTVTLTTPTPAPPLGQAVTFNGTVEVQGQEFITEVRFSVTGPVNVPPTPLPIPSADGTQGFTLDLGGTLGQLTGSVTRETMTFGYGYLPPIGYGYGYIPGKGTGKLSYTIQWVPPQAGAYTARLQAFVGSTVVDETEAGFTVAAPTPTPTPTATPTPTPMATPTPTPTPVPTPTPTPVPPEQVIRVEPPSGGTSVVVVPGRAVTVSSPGGEVSLQLPHLTGAQTFQVVLGPVPARLTLQLTPEEARQAGGDPGRVQVLRYDPEAGAWRVLRVLRVDLQTGQVTVEVTRFSFFAVAVVASPGDVNTDGVVDYLDLAILGASYGTQREAPGYRAEADLNDDGVVDVLDLGILGANYGRGRP